MNSKLPLVINIFGGPGCGKSTVTSGVFTLLKLNDINCELVGEFIKEKAWEGVKVVFYNQTYLFGQQYYKQYLLKKSVDVLIAECPLPSIIAYDRLHNLDGNKFLRSLIMDIFRGFNNFNFFLERKDEKFHQAGRYQTTVVEAKMVDEVILDVLREEKIPYINLKGYEDDINYIAKFTFQKLGKELTELIYEVRNVG